MKDLPIIKDIFAVINFNDCKNQEEIEAIKKAQIRLALTFLITCLLFCAMEFFKIKWADLKSPFFIPAIIAITIASVAAAILWRNKNKIEIIIELYKRKTEYKKYKEELEKTTPISKLTMKDGSVISGKFIEEKGWLQSLENNTLYNKSYISKIEII